MHFSGFFRIKPIARLILKCQILGNQTISDQSLLLSTILLNDDSYRMVEPFDPPKQNTISVYCITGSATLRVLNVTYNDIGDDGMAVISEALQHNKSLTLLRVEHCGLSVKGTVVY